MLRRLACRGALASVLLTLATTPSSLAPGARAAAPAGFQLETFEPLPETGLNLLNVSTSRMLERWRVAVGLTTHAAGESLSLLRTDEGASPVSNLVDDRVTSELSVALGLFGHVTLGAVLPVVLTQTGDDLAPIGRPGQSVSGTHLSDVRAIARVRFWYPEDLGGFGLHVALPVSLPTGARGELSSDKSVRFQPTLGLDYRNTDGFTLALNVGYLVRPRRVIRDLVVGAELRWAVGMEVPTGLAGLSLLGNVFGAYAVEANRDPLDLARPGTHHNQPIEVLGGLRVRPSSTIDLLLAGGAGVNNEVGAPTWRAVFQVGFTPTRSLRDGDGDGIIDLDDLCPDAPEDFDGFEDEDGCPDPDNDGDGILDVDDACPNEPEDFDGFEDEDGCPDPDNDGDGIPDALDQCPNEPEDFDGFEDEDGCPDLDNDGDGIPDALDQCPNEPEDFDGYQDGDGCIDPDNDKDGILDVNDLCPDFPETFNGLDDDDGCPDTRSRYVRVYTDHIQLLRPIYFEKQKAIVKPVSYAVLDDVAEVILSNAEISKVLIEGHTDDMGSPARNTAISEARARNVRDYLIKQGVDPGVLEIKGLGATRPLTLEETEVDRALNRRVEFRIIEVGGQPVTQEGKRP